MVQKSFFCLAWCKLCSVTSNILFVKLKLTSFMVVLVYVDDILIASNNNEALVELQIFLSRSLRLKILELLISSLAWR